MSADRRTSLTSERGAIQAARAALASRSWPVEAQRKLIIAGLDAVLERYAARIKLERGGDND